MSYREYRKDVLERQQRKALATSNDSYTSGILSNQQEIMKLERTEKHISSIKGNLKNHLLALEAIDDNYTKRKVSYGKTTVENIGNLPGNQLKGDLNPSKRLVLPQKPLTSFARRNVRDVNAYDILDGRDHETLSSRIGSKRRANSSSPDSFEEREDISPVASIHSTSKLHRMPNTYYDLHDKELERRKSNWKKQLIRLNKKEQQYLKADGQYLRPYFLHMIKRLRRTTAPMKVVRHQKLRSAMSTWIYICLNIRRKSFKHMLQLLTKSEENPSGVHAEVIVDVIRDHYHFPTKRDKREQLLVYQDLAKGLNGWRKVYLRKRGADMYHEIGEISNNRRLFKKGLKGFTTAYKKMKRVQAAYCMHIRNRLLKLIGYWIDFTSNRCDLVWKQQKAASHRALRKLQEVVKIKKFQQMFWNRVKTTSANRMTDLAFAEDAMAELEDMYIKKHHFLNRRRNYLAFHELKNGIQAEADRMRSSLQIGLYRLCNFTDNSWRREEYAAQERHDTKMQINAFQLFVRNLALRSRKQAMLRRKIHKANRKAIKIAFDTIRQITRLWSQTKRKEVSTVKQIWFEKFVGFHNEYITIKRNNTKATRLRQIHLLRRCFHGLVYNGGGDPKSMKFQQRIKLKIFVRRIRARKLQQFAYRQSFLEASWRFFRSKMKLKISRRKLQRKEFKTLQQHADITTEERYMKKFINRNQMCREREFQSYRSDVLYSKTFFRAVKKHIALMKKYREKYDKYDLYYYRTLCKRLIQRFLKEVRMQETTRKVLSLRQLPFLHIWYRHQHARKSARKCVVKMMARVSVKTLKPYFHLWRKDTIVERRFADGMVVKRDNTLKKAFRWFCFKTKKLQDGLILGDRCNEFLIAMRVLGRMHMFLSIANGRRRKMEYTSNQMGRYHLSNSLKSLYQNRCDSIADKLFLTIGRSKFFKRINTYWSMVVKNQSRNAYIETFLPYLYFQNWKRRIKRMIRHNRLIRNSAPFYEENLIRTHFKRFLRVTRFNQKAQKWAVVFDAYHQKKKLLRAMHKMDALVHCKWARENLCRLQLLGAVARTKLRVLKTLKRYSKEDDY